MMHHKLYTLFILLLSINISQAQELKVYRTVDRHCKDCSEMTYGRNGFELRDIGESKEDVEIRFHVSGEHISRSITVIKGNKRNFSAAYYFQYVDDFPSMKGPDSAKGLTQWEQHPFKRFSISGYNLDSIVSKLVANKIHELPNQKELVPNAGYYRQYSIETRMNGIVRKYHFGNLNQFMLNYPNMPEFKSYLAIVSIFKQLSIGYLTTTDSFKSK